MDDGIRGRQGQGQSKRNAGRTFWPFSTDMVNDFLVKGCGWGRGRACARPPKSHSIWSGTHTCTHHGPSLTVVPPTSGMHFPLQLQFLEASASHAAVYAWGCNSLAFRAGVFICCACRFAPWTPGFCIPMLQIKHGNGPSSSCSCSFPCFCARGCNSAADEKRPGRVQTWPTLQLFSC